ncbi:hypothetical protein H2200_000062 [Cladophialophora chaetospira]|uniref:Uncharacterized protein n=1 Tax=Cladophialophora chaetospira TaxID=386627 RepID=A0AA39CNV5_9EURO|nr:hypothetical protein H2200_000062 [Cladophialophora chaetospira]
MDARTADAEQSVWRDLSEDTFRRHLVQLEERTNAVPIDPRRFSVSSITDDLEYKSQLLLREDEQSLADAFAFLVAVEEGAQSVAAVCLEEDIQNTILTVRFAAVDAISESVQIALHQVSTFLVKSADAAMDTHPQSDELLQLITKLHFRRLLGRLRSSKWIKPQFLSRTHKKPLWQDFANLIHRVQFIYTKREASAWQYLEKELHNLAELYSSFESKAAGSEEEFTHLTCLIRRSYDSCTGDALKEYARRLRSVGSTSQIRSAIKTLHQIEKIAAYYRVSTTLVRASRRYPYYFQGKGLRLLYLLPYASIPTSIAYKEWAKTCHVHAEIQLIIYYDIHFPRPTTCEQSPDRQVNPNILAPRVIGTSKHLCYLCYLFLKAHGRFPPANTHGRLYDQWTIPDLVEFTNEQESRYMFILQQLDNEVVARAAVSPLWKPEPMTSRENLLDSMRDESTIALWRPASDVQSTT